MRYLSVLILLSGCATGRILDNVTRGTTNEVVRELDHIKGMDYKLDETIKNADQNRRAIETAFEAFNRIESRLVRMELRLDEVLRKEEKILTILRKKKLYSMRDGR